MTVNVTAYLRMQSGASIAGNWPVSWSGSWGNSSNTQGISLSGGQRQQIRSSSFTVSLTDSTQTRNVAISVNHFHGTTSNTLSISIGARYARTPTNLLVNRVSDSRIDLSWGRVGTYTSVNVQVQADSGSGFSTIGTYTASGNANSYASTGRIANRRYRFRVRGRTSGGASPWTSWSTIVYTTPATPSAPSAARSGNNIRVSLGGTTSLFGTHFDVQDDATGTIVGSAIPRGSFPWTHSNPNQTVRHRYRIRARRAQYSTGGTVLTSGYSSWSSWVELQSPPSAPTGLSPNGGSVELDAAVTLRWSHNPVDSSDQSQYELRHRLGSTGSWTTLTGTTASTRSVTFEEPGLHQWQVRTRGAHPDWSPWSATANLTAVTAPSVGLVTPDGESWMLPTMQVEWEFTQDDGLPQQGWRVELFNTDTDDAESLVESREGSTSASSVTLNTRLVRDGHYRVQVSVQSNGVWSEPVDQAFQVTFIPPSPPVIGGEWDEETGSVGLTVVDGRGPEIDDIVNVFPNPRFRTSDGLTPDRVNGHPNPGASYGTSGFTTSGALHVLDTAEVDWSNSGWAATFNPASAFGSIAHIVYGSTLDELADVLGLATVVGETFTIVFQWRVLGDAPAMLAPTHTGTGAGGYVDRSRGSGITPVLGQVYTDWITFTVAPLESGYETRRASLQIQGMAAPAATVQVSNVAMYQGGYDPSFEWFDGDSLPAQPGNEVSWSGPAGESVSVEGVPVPKHFAPFTGWGSRTVISDNGAILEVGNGWTFGSAGLDPDMFEEGEAYTIITEARLLSGEAQLVASVRGSNLPPSPTPLTPEWQEVRFAGVAGSSGDATASGLAVTMASSETRVEFHHLAIIPTENYPGPYFDGDTETAVIEGSSLTGVWDGEPDDSPSRLTMSEATVSVDIHRSIDDGETWEHVFGGDYDDELHVSDFESLSNGTTLYRATGYSLNGEPADAITEVVSDSTALWLGASETFDAVARLPLDPDVTINRTRLRQMEQYEGRALGVAYSSANQTREVTFSGTVPDTDIGIPSATRTELDDVSLNAWPVHLYRDPAGNRVYGICGPLDMARIGTEASGNTFWSYSGSLQETEK